LIDYVNHLPENEGSPTDTSKLPLVRLTADRLVLSAGTFGSTFLLLKNKANFDGLSANLGHYFSGNGDFLGFVHDAHETVGGARQTRVLAPSRGSVITSTIRVPRRRDGGPGGFYIQDGGYPDLVNWLVEATNGIGSPSQGGALLPKTGSSPTSSPTVTRHLTLRLRRSSVIHTDPQAFFPC
jgi:cholesterol oxidase